MHVDGEESSGLFLLHLLVDVLPQVDIAPHLLPPSYRDDESKRQFHKSKFTLLIACTGRARGDGGAFY